MHRRHSIASILVLSSLVGFLHAAPAAAQFLDSDRFGKGDPKGKFDEFMKNLAKPKDLDLTKPKDPDQQPDFCKTNSPFMQCRAIYFDPCKINPTLPQCILTRKDTPT
jgi:hypothetical protein